MKVNKKKFFTYYSIMVVCFYFYILYLVKNDIPVLYLVIGSIVYFLLAFIVALINNRFNL